MRTSIILILVILVDCCVNSTARGSHHGPQQSTTGRVPPKAVVERDAKKSFKSVGALKAQRTLVVPNYMLRHGCGPTAVGMVIGYYDEEGYTDLIQGDATTQTAPVNQAIASGGTSGNPNPLGSEQHYEDYSSPEDSWPNLLADAYITAGRPTHGNNCIADFMDTSRSLRGNYYGWSWSSDIGPSFFSYVNQQNPGYGPSFQEYEMFDGTLTWNVLTTEIDNNRPMVFLVDTDADGDTDHFVTLVGYNDDVTPHQYACRDTWQTGIRWEEFQPIGQGVPWGIWGAWSFDLLPLTGNHAPILSDPRVEPSSGTESTTFEFLVHYYDPDGDPPHVDYRTVHVSGGREEIMTLKSGSASNGTYHYTTTLPIGLYSYLFFFADDKGLADITNGQRGPCVYSDSDAVINIQIQCTNIACDLRLEYSLSGLGGPWTDIPITRNVLDPRPVPSGSTVYFRADVESANYEYRGWELYQNGSLVLNGLSSVWSFTLGTGTTEVGLNVFYRYTPQNYTISGTVLREDSSPVPGGVDFTLSSSQQTIALHTDNGNFSFGGINGGVSVTVTPSADGYAFAPASFVYECVDDNHIGEIIAAYSSDDYAPMTSFISVPPAVSEESNISFSWMGEDDVSVPANLLYQYKLDEVDIDWSAWTSGSSKTYDLENGAYTFWVRAQDEALNINQAPISYKFVVNAAPKVASAIRINRSVWASRVTLEMPVGASHPNDIFVLLPEHSGMSDPELVPVTIHRVDETTPCGASEFVAAELAVTERITKTSTGYLVSFPDPIAGGQTAQYDIIWGKIKYFGWQELTSLPDGFPNGGSIHDTYLDDSLRAWRSAAKAKQRGTGDWTRDSWVYMDVCNQYGIVTDETTLRFVRGESWGGTTGGTYTNFIARPVFKAGANICYLWKDSRYENDGSTDYHYRRYGLQIFDSAGNTVNSGDGTYYDGVRITLPSGLIHGAIWITARQDIGAHYYDPDEAWFLVLSQNGNEIISKTVFDTIQNANGAEIDGVGAYPLGNNVVFLWTRSRDTDNGRARQEIAYQVRDINGQLVKPKTILSPPLMPDSISQNDRYYVERVLPDRNGKLWVTIKRSIPGPDEYYYVILGTDGNVWKGPVQTSYLRSFAYCDKDGYIWTNENGQFFALNPDDTIAVPSRTAAWMPNQTVGLIAASVSSAGTDYRLYDRWSPQTIGIDVPAGVCAGLMQLFDLNLWGNNLHPADVNITKGATPIWSQTGQFTGQAAVNVSSMLDEGQNLWTISQDDFLGGQLLVTFPYNTLAGDITGDGKVNFDDIEAIAGQWLQTPGIPSADIAPCNEGDGIVNVLDFSVVAEHWLAHGATAQAAFVALYNGPSPTIDGVLSDGEWGSSYTVTMDRVDGGGQHNIGLYFQHDGTYLFVGVDSQWGSGWDVVWDIDIDGDYSRTLNGNLSQPYTDINICQQSPTGYSGYKAYRTLPYIGGERVGYDSGASSASSGSTNVSYEFRIPLADLGVIPGDSIGLIVTHGYDGIYQHLYQLSSAVSRDTVENWATLKLEDPE